MKTAHPLTKRAIRLLYQTKLVAVLVVLTLVSLLMAACEPARSPSLSSMTPTSLSSTKTDPPKESTPPSTPDLGLQLEAQTISPQTIIHNKDVKMTKIPPTPPPPGSTENQQVVQAKEDLAQRLGIPLEQIELLSFEAVTWPDGSLGCPEPGVEYIQIQREGSLIRLRAEKRIYQYHSGGGRAPFLCEHPSVPKDLPPPSGFGNE
jgi:hypothetical protein